jgi:pSer/pThr/pTyr-binding forkhead associated (FHA) protein
MGRLTVISDHLEGSYDLPEKPWKVGRGKDCDIQLVHQSVSRHHCIISESEGRIRVEDLGSTYGTYINGTQISDAHAGNGDKLKLGRIVLVYETSQSAESQPVSGPVSSPPNIAPTPPTPQASPPRPRLVPNRPVGPSSGSVPASPPQRPAPAPVARFKDSPPAEVKEEEAPPAPAPKAAGGVYNRLHGGHHRKGKAERPDYEKESEEWEQQAEAMARKGGSNYAAEAEDWERVWGKTKKRKGGFFFGGGSSGGGFMAVFGGLSAKLRAVILVGILGGMAMGGKVGYDRATAHILVPNNVPTKKTLRPTVDNKDAILEKAVETFGKTIPEELREKD